MSGSRPASFRFVGETKGLAVALGVAVGVVLAVAAGVAVVLGEGVEVAAGGVVVALGAEADGAVQAVPMITNKMMEARTARRVVIAWPRFCDRRGVAHNWRAVGSHNHCGTFVPSWGDS